MQEERSGSAAARVEVRHDTVWRETVRTVSVGADGDSVVERKETVRQMASRGATEAQQEMRQEVRHDTVVVRESAAPERSAERSGSRRRGVRMIGVALAAAALLTIGYKIKK